MQTLVIKVGSSLLIDAHGQVRKEWLNSLLEDCARVQRAGTNVVLVASGSVALGAHALKKERRTMRLHEKQAAAATGQFYLVQAYADGLSRFGVQAAQVLLTIEDSEIRRRFMNARHTLLTLLEHNIIPIINENDAVATSEMRFGDNDRLAARVAQMLSADRLILFSDIDGLYTENPKENPHAQHIPLVETIDDKLMQLAGGSGSTHGSGGMVTKLIAASIATASGCETIITRGDAMHPLTRFEQGALHTRFAVQESPLSARKRWIAHRLIPNGAVIVDAGAEQALRDGKSLLAAGVIRIEGQFERGDSVQIKNQHGHVIGTGLVAYPWEEAQRICGKASQQFIDLLGYEGRGAVIHRDDLVLA
jgi:glutamate 5-kinase